MSPCGCLASRMSSSADMICVGEIFHTWFVGVLMAFHLTLSANQKLENCLATVLAASCFHPAEHGSDGRVSKPASHDAGLPKISISLLTPDDHHDHSNLDDRRRFMVRGCGFDFSERFNRHLQLLCFLRIRI